jgi:hypothetical protein
MCRLLVMTCVFVVTAGSVLSTQKGDSNRRIAREVSWPVQVVFGKTGDGLPEKMDVIGRITEVSFSTPCGTIAWAGTIKLELLEKSRTYPHKNVYVVMLCLQDRQNEKKYLGKVVKLKLLKLYPKYRHSKDDSFYFELIENTINSRGVPFYCTYDEITP